MNTKRYRFRRIVAAFGLIAISIIGLSQMVQAQNTATVSATDQQTVKGWGCCPIWIDNHDISKQPLTQKAAYNMGATIIRHSQLSSVGDGDGNITPTGADKLCRAIQITNDAGLPYILSCWTPPLDMKTIAVFGSVSNGTKVSLKTDKEQSFCNLAVNLFNYISKTKGLSLPKAYSFQNEPTCVTDWGGCIYDAIQYKRVAKLMRATLDAAGYTDIMLLGPEDGGYYNGTGWNWSLGLLGGNGFPSFNDKDFKSAIGGIASHSYDWKPYTPIANYNAWVTSCDKWGKDRWQTEYSPIEDLSVPQTISTIRRFVSDMAFLKNNYWFIWTVNDGYGNTNTTDLCFGDGVNSLTKRPSYYVLKKLFSSIPIGSKVRRVTTTDNELVTDNAGKMDMVAFASDTNMVVVMVNPTTSVRVTDIKGLTGSSAKVYQMSATTNNRDMELIGSPVVADHQVSGISMPPNSVTIVVNAGVATKLSDLEINPEQFEVYPNPVKDGVIRIRLKGTEDQVKVSVSLIDLQGKLICTKNFSGKSELIISAPEIQAGVYLINNTSVKT